MKDGGRDQLRTVRAALPQGLAAKLSFVVGANVMPIVPDISPILAHIAAVGTQVALVMPNIVPQGPSFPVISIPNGTV